MRASVLLLIAVTAASSCEGVKVPIIDIQAGFTLADVSWFEAEQTLFVFYRVDAQQGLGPESQIELAWRTDSATQDFAPLSAFAPVHTHLPVDCGKNSLCGSTSIRVPTVPREVKLRLRYHRDGAMTLDAPVVFNVINAGPAFSHRSLTVYGVFDETNTRIQWRARHQFPTLRNEEAQQLGLRRFFQIASPAHGVPTDPLGDSPYGYAAWPSCPASFTGLGWAPLSTTDRAAFAPEAMPDAASASSAVCATATVTDATGTFEAIAIARKNPQVAPAFPALRSPIQVDTQVGFLLHPCNRIIDETHREMQVQRLLLDGDPEICIDDWAQPGFASRLAAQFQQRIDQERANGKDMILLFALHHDDATGALAGVVEDALALVLPFERDKSSPRVSGAFVFDSFSHTVQDPELARLTLWCPANLPGDDLDTIPDTSSRSCPLLPDLPDAELGPFKFNQIPILPTRAQYLTFVSKYGEAQAGQTQSLEFRAPVRTPISQNVPAGPFGVATFFNDEILTALPTDVFSYCAPTDANAQNVVYRSAADPALQPLSSLPDAHALAPQPEYDLGVLWDFPFLFRLTYQVVLAGNLTAFQVTVPFGIGTQAQSYYGTQLWETGQFPLADVLLRCSRFCDHPTFDSAGVYQVSTAFADTYRDQCYQPLHPVPPGEGFPLDP